MELQDQMKSDWSQCFCTQPLAEFDTSVNHQLLCREVKGSCVCLEGHPDAYCNIWTNAEPTRVKSCNSRSFAMDARIRLNHLKSGCNSPLPCRAKEGMLFNYDFEKDIWDSEEPQTEQSALDLVEILDIEDAVQDEESWLYESPKKQPSVEQKESALRWCRHVLDNPSPEMEAACHVLMNILNKRSKSHDGRNPAGFHHVASHSGGSSVGETSDSMTHNMSDSLDDNVQSVSNDSITTSYRLHDITDVHIMAQIQEASLRQDYISMPTTASLRRNPTSAEMFSSSFNSTFECTDDFTPGNKTKVTSSACWQPGLPSLSSSSCQSPTSVAKQSCQSPKLTRLHQQVTQFKLLKLAQNQAASPSRTRSPLRTSLRTLQAVRNSRSLDTDDFQPPDQISPPPSGVSSSRMGSSYSSTSHSPAPLKSAADPFLAAMKRLQRSQSFSPCRIPHPAQGCRSARGRVFASPERSSSAAWARNVPSIQR